MHVKHVTARPRNKLFVVAAFMVTLWLTKPVILFKKKRFLFCQNMLNKFMNNYISRIILITKYTDHFSPFLNPRFKVSSNSNTELIENKTGKRSLTSIYDFSERTKQGTNSLIHMD